jgi:hypothetical protein
MATEGASGHVHSNIADIVAIQRQVSLEPGAQYSQVVFFLTPQLSLMLMMQPFSVPCTPSVFAVCRHKGNKHLT